MKSVSPSSSIRFAIYEVVVPPRRRLAGKIGRIGLSGTNLTTHDQAGEPVVTRMTASNLRAAVDCLLDWLAVRPVLASVKAAGHRVVGGMKHSEPKRVTPKLLAELHRITPYAPITCPAKSV